MTEEAPLTYEGTELVATLNTRLMLLWFYLSLAFSAFFGHSFFIKHKGVLCSDSNKSFIFFIVGVVAAFLFFFLSRNNRTQLLVNRNGIWDSSLGQIPWDQIRSFSIVRLVRKYDGVDYLVLQDHKLQEKNINIKRLNKNNDEIVAAIWHYAKKHGIYNSGKTEMDP